MGAAHYVVTGGAGFIGSHLVDALVARNHQVVVLDDFSSGRRVNLQPAERSGRVRVVSGDVRSAELVRELARGARGIFHLAALVSVPRSIEAPHLSFDINIRGTLNVLEAARVERVPHVVYASSAAVYGDAPPPVREQTLAAQCLSPYALDKRVAEQYAALFSQLYGITTTVLRFFNVYGLRQPPNSPYSGAISIFAEKIASGAGVSIHGDGDQTRDFIHVADVVRATLLSMENGQPGAHVFNVGTGVATSINRLIEVLASIGGRAVATQHAPARAGDIRHSLADITEIRQRLGFKPAVGLASGLRELLDGL